MLKNNRNIIVLIFFLLTGILLIYMGLSRGEASDVFRKAIMLCLECIGIG